VAESFKSFELVGKDYYKQSILSQHLQSWTEKPLNGQFLQDVSFQISVSVAMAMLLKGDGRHHICSTGAGIIYKCN